MTADKEAAVTTHELTHATSTPAHEKNERHRDCFAATYRPYVSRSVGKISVTLPDDRVVRDKGSAGVLYKMSVT